MCFPFFFQWKKYIFIIKICLINLKGNQILSQIVGQFYGITIFYLFIFFHFKRS
jgi:hypothetical protein